MGARFLSSTGPRSGNLIERAQFFPVPALIKIGLPKNGIPQMAFSGEDEVDVLGSGDPAE